jgi:UDP-N-acetylmuramoyl-L-alanyl-D-glutamate--2,6-diaminopimelate ligase
LKFPAEKKIKYGIKDAEILPKSFKLLGKFNLYNAITASEIATSQGISLEICKKSLEKAEGIPGRMEVVIKKPFTVIVDYAHTPEALEQAYKSIVEKNKRMICVLGACGGGRDKWKRPVLGKIAAKYCQEIIITNEDPYDEEPMEIIEQVAEGAGNRAKKILDRRDAIRQALRLAKGGDVVIITGKGSEPWMCVEKSKKIPWDDRQVVKDLIFSKK